MTSGLFGEFKQSHLSNLQSGVMTATNSMFLDLVPLMIPQWLDQSAGKRQNCTHHFFSLHNEPNITKLKCFHVVLACVLIPSDLPSYAILPNLRLLCSFSGNRSEEGNSLGQHDTNTSTILYVPIEGGWDYSNLSGNFLIIDLEFWYNPTVSLLFLGDFVWSFKQVISN